MSVPFSGRQILVVGGAGFVGSNLVRLLLDQAPARIVVIDNLMSSEKENIPADARVEFRQGSIADRAMLDGFGDEFDYVFHLACYHGNQSSIHDPIADHDNNLITTLQLFNKMRDYKRVKKVVYSAAGCAVAEKTDKDAKATDEEAPISLDMDSPYSISKVAGEFYSVYFHRHHGLPTVRARFQNVYGPGEVLGAGQWRGTPATVWRNVTPTFIYKSLQHMALPLENEGRGSRDFIFVEDICRGLMACAEKGAPGDVYNLASGVETTIRELADKINALTGNPTPPDILPKRPWDNSIKRFGSGEKAKQEIGFACQVSLAEGLRRTVDWTKARLEFIQATMAKHSQHLEMR